MGNGCKDYGVGKRRHMTDLVEFLASCGELGLDAVVYCAHVLCMWVEIVELWCPEGGWCLCGAGGLAAGKGR